MTPKPTIFTDRRLKDNLMSYPKKRFKNNTHLCLHIRYMEIGDVFH